ncbi:centromere protein X-like isoform X3 [Amphibalanus amphitrite]|uniref:centromere protein X-like isoform X3 n=1 Tax=Amphibalanus amphitrite TaxID=1232801 RepID=UPI001C9041EA|nr:centromere protein X-like isoform X3 [Amphibalanus amphitrite]
MQLQCDLLECLRTSFAGEHSGLGLTTMDGKPTTSEGAGDAAAAAPPTDAPEAPAAPLLLKERTVEELMRLHFSSPRTRLGAEGLRLTTMALQLYVREAALRASDQARLTGAPEVGLEHLEKVLPQWLMDI